MTTEIQYKRMDEIGPGDVLFTSNGEETTVTDVYDVHVPEKMYRLRFGNGEIIEASGNHLWYTVTSLDKQLHKDRIKRARKSILPKINGRKMAWLQRIASGDNESSPRVDASFILEVLDADSHSYTLSGVDKASDDHIEYANQILRILESIGPVEMHNGYIYHENNHSHLKTYDETRVYSLKVFCEQMLALIAEALGEKSLHPYELKIGKVRTTEQIMNTQDLGHEFPEANPSKNTGIFGKFRWR